MLAVFVPLFKPDVLFESELELELFIDPVELNRPVSEPALFGLFAFVFTERVSVPLVLLLTDG